VGDRRRRVPNRDREDHHVFTDDAPRAAGSPEETTMLDWVEYRSQLMGRIGEIGKLSPGTVQGYQTLTTAGTKTNHLDAKTRELISLAVAVTARCDGCITVHTAEALKTGATKEEIAEALGVAVAMNAGAALVYSARVMDATEAYAKA
jgi:AhpD family alkylhydroperoxidase